MLFADLVATSERVAATRSRKAKSAALAQAIAALDDTELETGIAYLSGELPQGRIGLGYATVHAVTPPPAPRAELTIGAVASTIDDLAAVSGRGSKQRRHDLLTELLSRATEAEQSFLRRLLLRELRQGALEGVMVEAIAAATGADGDAVRRAAMVSGDLPRVAAAARGGTAAALAEFRLTLFQPLQPMLAQTAEDMTAALGRFSPAIVETKIDGARIQVHRVDDRVEVYTRNLRPITSAVPEIVALAVSLPLDRFILDGEAIALRSDGRPYPFQVSMSRFGRDRDDGGPALTPFFFDCLHLDGDDLLDLAAEERFRRLSSVVGREWLPRRIVTGEAQEAERFFAATVAAGHEGVMVKDPASTYAAGRRGAAWLKVKPAHTLDLVVLAVEWGSGRRRGWLSNLHLGARGPASGGYVMLGKTFKGLTDAVLEWQTERFLELETHREGHIVFVRPEQVVEIAFDGIQASSRYPGGMALRFARVKGYRHDKTADEADTIDTVRAIFEHRFGE